MMLAPNGWMIIANTFSIRPFITNLRGPLVSSYIMLWWKYPILDDNSWHSMENEVLENSLSSIIRYKSTGFWGGWVYHFFYLLICWSNRMSSLLLCYYFTYIFTSKGDISVLALIVIYGGLFISLLLYK